MAAARGTQPAQLGKPATAARQRRRPEVPHRLVADCASPYRHGCHSIHKSLFAVICSVFAWRSWCLAALPATVLKRGVTRQPLGSHKGLCATMGCQMLVPNGIEGA